MVREGNQSLDAVLKGGFELRKLVSTTGPGSPAPKLEGAGFTIYRIPDLSKANQFTRAPDGSYNIQSVLDAYRKDNYDSETLKYDFSNEAQAIARMFESDTELVYGYNATLTEAGDYANGSGLGWVPTGTTNEYRLSEIFTNEEGIIRVTGLPLSLIHIYTGTRKQRTGSFVCRQPADTDPGACHHIRADRKHGTSC